MSIKIGIPRGLFYFTYYPLWKAFFDSLSVETILSIPTNKEILDNGITHAVSDICVSLKCYHGHVKFLIDGDKVDHIFVPRVLGEKRGRYNCPKLIALPDLMKSAFSGEKDKILEVEFQFGYGYKKLQSAFLGIGEALGISQSKIKKAAKEAHKAFVYFNRLKRKGFTFLEALSFWEGGNYKGKEKGEFLVGIVGFPYDVYDDFLNGGILAKLDFLHIDYIVSDMIPYSFLKKFKGSFPKELFWHQSNVALKSGFYFLHSKEIQGVIVVSSFGCGLSAIYTKLLELYNRKVTKKPLMIITIDEQTGDVGLKTRIEAFIDMLKMKRDGFL